MWVWALVGCWVNDAEIARKAVDPRVVDPDVADTDPPDTDPPDTGRPDTGPPDTGEAALSLRDLFPGDLVITEVMRNPSAVEDARGEWLEITSLRAQAVDLDGMWLVDDGSDAWQVRGTVLVPPGGFVVFGASDRHETNGGAPVDAEWFGIALANGADEVSLKGPDDVTFDRVRWTTATAGESGHSMSLDPLAHDAVANDRDDAWCEPVERYGDGDHGTPGRRNGRCL